MPSDAERLAAATAEYQAIYDEFESRMKNFRGPEVEPLLEKLGFRVKHGKRGGHRVFMHDGLSDFTSSSYNAGGGATTPVKRNYIRNILKVLKNHEPKLIELLMS